MDSGFASYGPSADVFDEAKDGSGLVRPHWEEFGQAIERLGAQGLAERRENAWQLLREHGVTFNVYADGRSAERTWELDMLPLLISAREWAQLEPGLIQRTRLLNLVLADLYGPQRLLAEGLLPPALLHANPGFLRACHGVRPPHDRFLSLHAVDLTRAPDGQWWVLADRTQAPSGVGYALENRTILSRVLADEFRESNVQRLASFFIASKAGLRAMAPWTNSPQVVLMTPGPLSETYFEHAYLARHLGYPLVEGGDLTVRDRRVFMKTLEGLQPVDIIIRRVDDVFCDPLELRADSFLGVPGLVEAARAGHVVISNALGSGAVEAPALLAFLPALARHLLGEELRIPNVATWWCGQPHERAYALANLHSLVIKHGFVGGSADPLFGAALAGADLAEVAARIRAEPHMFLGQERVALSTAPVWTGDHLEPRPLILRCFVCATSDGYAVMPGGLTRVSAAPDSPVVSSKYGGGSKDTWVLSDGPVEELTLTAGAALPERLERSNAQVPSRVIETFFWLGRYAERLESTTRLLRTALARLAGEGTAIEEAELVAITRTLVGLQSLPEKFWKRASHREITAELRDLVFNAERAGGVRALIRRVSYLTAGVRDRLSGDTWRILNHLQTEFPAAPGHSTAGAVVSPLHRLIFQLAALTGMEMENMTRGQAWRFLEIGRRIERASNLLATIRAVLAVDPDGAVALTPLLEYTDSTMSYRRRYFARPELPTTLDFLLAQDSNPRALAFQFKSLRRHLGDLPALGEAHPEQWHFAEMDALLAGSDFQRLAMAARESEGRRLDDLLQELLAGCRLLSDQLTAHYFTHVLAQAS
jgi:uncharacterized circularly permuted ATP-grasp superfamily protein/uncharacterized alpha-E superfamily protein